MMETFHLLYKMNLRSQIADLRFQIISDPYHSEI